MDEKWKVRELKFNTGVFFAEGKVGAVVTCDGVSRDEIQQRVEENLPLIGDFFCKLITDVRPPYVMGDFDGLTQADVDELIRRGLV